MKEECTIGKMEIFSSGQIAHRNSHLMRQVTDKYHTPAVLMFLEVTTCPGCNSGADGTCIANTCHLLDRSRNMDPLANSTKKTNHHIHTIIAVMVVLLVVLVVVSVVVIVLLLYRKKRAATSQAAGDDSIGKQKQDEGGVLLDECA